MSEPRATARRTIEVVPGVRRWSIRDERIGGAESDAYAITTAGRVTLIDPLPLVEGALVRLGSLEAIVLTAANHQRSAWRLRRERDLEVYAPEGPTVGTEPGQLEEEPDVRYGDGEHLPGGLIAIHTPGPAYAMYSLWLDGERRVLFVSDLLARERRGLPSFLPSEYQDDPRLTRVSVRRLAETLPVDVVCFAHGPPIVKDGRAALERALTRDAEQLEPVAPTI